MLRCCHFITVSALQLVAVKQELAVRVSELTHVSTSLQEHKDSQAHTRSQLATVQDNLGGQLRALQRELSATQAEKLQSDREVGRLQQEGRPCFRISQFAMRKLGCRRKELQRLQLAWLVACCDLSSQ